MLLNTLILIYGGILLISALMALFLWNTYKHVLLKELFLFWISGIAAFGAQAAFTQFDLKGFLAFSINWMTVIYLLRILGQATGIELPYKKYHLVIFASVVIGAINLVLGGQYFYSALIFCAASSGVLFHGATRRLLDSEYQDRIIYGYRILLVIDAIHFLDYPFVIPNLQWATIGFSVTLIFFFCFAIYVPTFILRRISADYTRELENQVLLRTMQLSESQVQLSVAFENLKAKSSQIESLLVSNKSKLNSLVHDIANPLQVVWFYSKQLTELLSEEPEKAQKMKKLQTAASSILQIINEAKANHALDTNLENGMLTKVDLGEVIGECIELFQHKLDSKKIKLDIELTEDEKLQIYGHSGWLKNQILSNLISNAIKFTPQGGWIKISTQPKQMDPKKIVLRVKDSGVGISEDVKEKLFDLYQLTSSIGTNGELGTGLGLPIVRQYVQLMGGKIAIADDGQPGACFELELKKVI